MRRETTMSRELVRPCECGRPVMHYVTSTGRKAAPYCQECARERAIASVRAVA